MSRPGPILIYSQYDWDLERFGRILAAALPNIELNFAGSAEQARPYLRDTEILYGWGFSTELLREMPKLRWVQKMGAGVDDLIGSWPADRDIILTRTDGRLISRRMVEYVLGAILDRTLHFAVARAQQRQRSWAYYEAGSIKDLTIGIAGLGEIGTEIAQVLRSLGPKVIGWRRSLAANESVSELFCGHPALHPFVQQCDVVVLVLPLTNETKGLINREVFTSFKPNTHLVNIGRGGVLEEDHLLEAIAAGHVGHATLDVFEKEPLPVSHPFWANDHITVTPHVCGPLVPEDVAPHFIANYRAYATGKPLQNIIDLKRQY